MTPDEIQKLESNLENPGIERPVLESGKSTFSKPKPVSAFRMAKRFVAGKFRWNDTVFSYGEFTDPMRERHMEKLKAIHEWLGISMEAMARVTQPELTPTKEDIDAYNAIPAERWNEYPEKMEAVYEDVLTELLVDWQDPEVSFDKEFIPALGYELKSEMVKHISESSQFGKSQNFT